MAEASAHRGPDGTKTITLPHIGFGHSMLQTTPESQSEILPYTDLESGLTITADARIDNREELCDKLGIQQSTTLSDSMLIVSTYKRWGVAGFAQLIGDFSFALWEPAKQRLICARDYIGVKPFYYYRTSKQFLFSSEIKQIVEYPRVPLTPNEGMVAEYLVATFRSKTETLFRHISRIAPGHFLITSPEQFTVKQFWSPQPNKRIWYKNSSDYTEHFLDIFRSSVGSMLRTTDPVSVSLSGGLDSSSVVGMACNILRESNHPDPEIYSAVYPGLHCDEEQYIDIVAEALGLQVHKIPSHEYVAESWLKQAKFSHQTPYPVNLTMNNNLKKRIANSGSRVLLSGIGGDEWFQGSGYPYLDFILGKRFKDLKEQFYFSFSRNKHAALKRLLVNLFWSSTPCFLRKALCTRQPLSLPKWLPEDFLKSSDIRNRIVNSDQRLTLDNLGALSTANIHSNGTESFVLDNIDRYHASLGIEFRSPFLDRRIADYAISIPDYECYCQGQTKFLLRQEANYTLPTQIKKRHSKAEFSFFINAAFLSPQFNKYMKNLSISKRGWIDTDILQEKFIAVLEGIKKNRHSKGGRKRETFNAIAIEIWHRAAFKT